MACPYFFPTEKSSSICWNFPHRLPLGTGFSGVCTAGGEKHTPEGADLKEFCNLGYAGACPRIPAERHSDAVRFAVASDSGQFIVLHYSCERDHAPVEHGQLRYDCGLKTWTVAHSDRCIQRQAECYLATYLERRLR